LWTFALEFTDAATSPTCPEEIEVGKQLNEKMLLLGAFKVQQLFVKYCAIKNYND